MCVREVTASVGLFVAVSVEVVDEVVDIVVPTVDAMYDYFMYLLVMVPL